MNGLAEEGLFSGPPGRNMDGYEIMAEGRTRLEEEGEWEQQQCD